MSHSTKNSRHGSTGHKPREVITIALAVVEGEEESRYVPGEEQQMMAAGRVRHTQDGDQTGIAKKEMAVLCFSFSPFTIGM